MNMTTTRGSAWSDGRTTIGRHLEHRRAMDDGYKEMNGYE